MKKAKIMLTAITVLAVVGGALAFKAKKYDGTQYCTGTTTAANKCINSILNGKLLASGAMTYYKVTTDATKCGNTPGATCTSSGTIVSE